MKVIDHKNLSFYWKGSNFCTFCIIIYISLDNFREINVNTYYTFLIYWSHYLLDASTNFTHTYLQTKVDSILQSNPFLFFQNEFWFFFFLLSPFFFFFQNQNSVPGFQDLVTVQCAASLIHMLVLLLLHKNFRFHPNLTTMKFSMKWHGTLTKEANQRIEKKITSRILATLSLLLFS